MKSAGRVSLLSNKKVQAPISRRRNVGNTTTQSLLTIIFVVLGLVLIVGWTLYTQAPASLSTTSAVTSLSEPALSTDSSLIKRAQQNNEDHDSGALQKWQQLAIRSRKADNAPADEKHDIVYEQEKELKEVLALTLTNVGTIQITLRPDFSQESVEYIHRLVDEGCRRCKFYRAEKPGILQGIVANEDVPLPTTKGPCPPGYDSVKNDCPPWDAQCACHGPVLERGNVAWAAGATGPDFFIDDYKQTADWWGTQHTVWGKIEDEASFAVLDYIWTLPTQDEDGMTMLKEDIHFDIELFTTEVTQ